VFNPWPVFQWRRQGLRRRHKSIAARMIFTKFFSAAQKTVDALRRFLLNHLLSLVVSLLEWRDSRRRSNARSTRRGAPLRSSILSFMQRGGDDANTPGHVPLRGLSRERLSRQFSITDSTLSRKYSKTPLRFARSGVFLLPRRSSSALEKLHGSFVPLRFLAGLECAQVPAFAGLGVLLARIESVLA
jgi:hypothetical protein